MIVYIIFIILVIVCCYIWGSKDLALSLVILAVIFLGVIPYCIIRWVKWLGKHLDDDKHEESKYQPSTERDTISSTSYAAPRKTTPSVTISEKYNVYHRSYDGFADNMNCHLYKCRALYINTKRMRTIKDIQAFDEDGVIEQLKRLRYTEPFEIERVSFPEASDAQKEVLGNIYYGDVCMYDASALISKKDDRDSVPNPDLLEYATECKICLSYYIGKKALYDKIFWALEGRDKIAFFVFCVYRYTTDDRRANLNKSPHRELFYTFADDNLSNDSFIKSMNRYSGRELRFFGTLTINSRHITGGSTQTIAYKTALEFLRRHFTLITISHKSL